MQTTHCVLYNGPGGAFLSATLVDNAPRQVCKDRIKRARLIYVVRVEVLLDTEVVVYRDTFI